eukprot:COSAG02_NODE_14305_length_1287_cov_1.012626_2_plen_84_part_00
MGPAGSVGVLLVVRMLLWGVWLAAVATGQYSGSDPVRAGAVPLATVLCGRQRERSLCSCGRLCSYVCPAGSLPSPSTLSSAGL